MAFRLIDTGNDQVHEIGTPADTGRLTMGTWTQNDNGIVLQTQNRKTADSLPRLTLTSAEMSEPYNRFIP
jgi:hypothetical protein